jgi:hypothetical protein
MNCKGGLDGPMILRIKARWAWSRGPYRQRNVTSLGTVPSISRISQSHFVE